jgi:predicted ArsR family transcriptional regulator
VEIQRVEHIIAGARRCVYHISQPHEMEWITELERD